jgi:outer membrane receptor protein involved in Fe transport
MPALARFDLILGYSRKIGRVRWSTQVNINNLFNEYHVVIYPNQTSGWSVMSSLTANYDQQPRYIAWRNTISF